MSSYKASILCACCGKVLATVEAKHEKKNDWFVPQDIVEEQYKLPSMFCNDCLNGKEVK